MASFHDAIEMALSDDEEAPGLGEGNDPHHEVEDDELPFLEPAARADMSEGSDGEGEGAELPGVASEESEGEDEHARPPPPPPPPVALPPPRHDSIPLNLLLGTFGHLRRAYAMPQRMQILYKLSPRAAVA